jgi:hypothetical protein
MKLMNLLAQIEMMPLNKPASFSESMQANCPFLVFPTAASMA